MEELFIPPISKSRKPKAKSRVNPAFKNELRKKQLLLKKHPPKAAPLVGLLAFGAKSQSQKPNQTGPKSPRFYKNII